MDDKCSLLSMDIRTLSSKLSSSPFTSGLILVSFPADTSVEDIGVKLLRVNLFKCELLLEVEGCVAASEKERDLGIVNTTVGELGEGLLLRLSTGLDPGVVSRE